MTATQSPVQREILYDSGLVSWERIRARNENAWIQQIKFLDWWLFLMTDEAGRNHRDCSSEEDCYRIIEEVFPVTSLVGNRKNGAIEVAQAAAKMTI
jgi:hypothetical protein